MKVFVGCDFIFVSMCRTMMTMDDFSDFSTQKYHNNSLLNLNFIFFINIFFELQFSTIFEIEIEIQIVRHFVDLLFSSIHHPQQKERKIYLVFVFINSLLLFIKQNFFLSNERISIFSRVDFFAFQIAIATILVL